MQRLIAYLCAASVMALSFMLYTKLEQQEYKAINLLFQEEQARMRHTIEDHINSSIIALRRMAQRWEIHNKTDRNHWNEDARHYVKDFPALTTVEWVDSTYHVKWIEPLKGNEKALGLNIVFNKEREDALKGAAEREAITITPPLDLVQGYRAFIAYVPIHLQENRRFDGFMVGIYDIEAFLKNVLGEQLEKHYDIHITEGDHLVYTSTNVENQLQEKWGQTDTITFFDKSWSFTAWPKPAYLTHRHSFLAEIVLLAGMLIAILFGLAVHYAITARQGSKLLNEKTDALNHALSDKEKLIDRLMSSNEDLERFAYVCSHDLQEPLRMICSFSEILEEHLTELSAQDEELKSYLGFITKGAENAQTLIASILTYSSLNRDTQKPEPVDTNELVENIRETLCEKQNTGSISLTKDELPIVIGNKTQLFQLFQNLINNGLKYQQPGESPAVHIGMEDGGEYWIFSFSDNGIGIDDAYLGKIFDVFQRLHSKDEYQGTGIGLSICKKVIEQHGGKIWVESEKGKGSTFYVTIQKPENTPAQGNSL